MTKLFIVRVAPLILIVIVVCLFEYKYVHCVDFNISNTGNATDMEIVDLLYCSNRRCVDFGERCDDQFPFSGPMCYQPYRCVNKTCANPLTLGDPCNINSDCDQAKGQFCVYYFGDGLKICRIANYAQFGESCSVDYECMMGLDCFPGPNGTKVCSTPVTGCINDGQCDQSSVCNFTRVDDEGPVGECVKLNLTSDQCTLFSTIGDCANAYCTPIANGSNIGICTTNPKLGDLCITSRITCNTLANHYCQNFPGSVYGTCQILPKPSFRVCYNVGDCEPYEFCRCDTKASIGYCTTRGQVVGSNCQDSLNLLIFCLTKTNCTSLFNLHPLSCAYKHCPREANCFKLFCTEPLLSTQMCIKKNSCDLTAELETIALSNIVANLTLPNCTPSAKHSNSFSYLLIFLLFFIVFK